MLVQFSSVKTESVTMFGNVAVELIHMLGASGKIPGALSADDLPAAIDRLRDRLKVTKPSNAVDASQSDESDDDDSGNEPPVALAARAQPLLDILERARDAHVPVMWEQLNS